MSRVAVIGGGISGLGAAWLLAREHDVVLFERETRLGGHTHTHHLDTLDGPLAVDTGLIVHNDRTCPLLVRLFDEIGVERIASDMSFGVSDPATTRSRRPSARRSTGSAAGFACRPPITCSRSAQAGARSRSTPRRFMAAG